MSQKWPPDFRVQQDYLNPENATPQEWAWEFLRRNIQYQADYAEANQPGSSKYKAICKEYSLQELVDPAQAFFSGAETGSYRNVRFALPAPPKVEMASRAIEDSPYSLSVSNSDELLLKISDINEPMDAILETVEKLITIARQYRLDSMDATPVASDKSATANQWGKFCDYLRAWDANESGMNQLDTARMLGDVTDRTIRNMISEAKRLINGGYKELLKRPSTKDFKRSLRDLGKEKHDVAPPIEQ